MKENTSLPKVAVLLSTYNGEQYLREQLESIFGQESVNVILYARDDGSQDGTKQIIKEFSSANRIVQLDDGRNLGPGLSFMELLYSAAEDRSIDYFAFADQDDIWLPDKLKAAIDKIAEHDADRPVLYSSNQYLYIDGEKSGCRYTEPQTTELIPHITKNTISGCTFVLNRALARAIADTEHADWRIIKFRLHDAWVMLAAIVCGDVIYDETPHILYRIHQNNTVGIRGISVKQRADRLRRLYKKKYDSNSRMITAQQLLRSFPDADREHKRVLELFANYQNSWKDKNALAFNKQIRKNCGEKPWMFTVKTIINFV